MKITGFSLLNNHNNYQKNWAMVIFIGYYRIYAILAFLRKTITENPVNN